MSFSNTFETALLGLIFNNAAIANLGDATGPTGSASAGNLFISLHSADVGEAGNQSSSELAYTGYARVPVARTSIGWTISGSSVINAAQIQFPQCTGGIGNASHFAIGCAVSGAGSVVLKGALSSTLAISSGITPLFAAGALSATLD
jgi:hypothetical protein